MEESLLVKGKGGEKRGEGLRWVLVGEEVKRLGCLAAPMVAVILSQYLLQVISLMMVGHLGELALSSTAIAISLSGVTGFSFLVSCITFFFPFSLIVIAWIFSYHILVMSVSWTYPLMLSSRHLACVF